ncbi:MAG TPA: propionyl-CoA synthetase [Thermoanaerobaculia bacterium]|nr:propionyl-CoA synthetase [Thermoanaerobaculia bacterium]
MANTYDEVYQRSIRTPDDFWADAAEDVHWFRRWERVLDRSNAPLYRWFTGAVTNTCYNAVDIHVERGRGEQAALVYDSPLTNTIKSFTYRELRDLVARFAGALENLGVTKGDRVILYMPMIPEAVVAMLACARIGAIHSVVFGGFAANELAKRIADAKPKVIVSASCGIEPGRVIAYKPMLDEAIDLSPSKPEACVMVQRSVGPALAGRPAEAGAQTKYYDWNDVMRDAHAAVCVPVDATDPLYILYTSGTTGHPKGVMRDNGGHLVALKWSMKNVFGVEPGEVFWAASDIGWVVGHSYIVYAPLFHGCTTILYEGKPVGTPDPGAFWRVITQHGVSVLFTAPTAFRAIKRDDPNGEFIRKYSRDKFRYLFLAGERCDPDTLLWAKSQLGVPVIDHWWQTETGWPVGANCAGLGLLPVKPGSCTKPVPGYDIRVVDERGSEVPWSPGFSRENLDGSREGAAKAGAPVIGNVVIKLPLPPGCLPTMWNADDEYKKWYLTQFPGYYKTADAGYIDSDGYLWIMSRTDDIINVAGHRLSTGALEEVLASHPAVAECAVVGVADEIKGEVPVGLVVLKSGVKTEPKALIDELIHLVRDKVGPVASFKQSVIVKRLPKTRSGKIVRGTIKKIAEGSPYNVPATIDDPATLSEIADDLATVGYPRIPANART